MLKNGKEDEGIKEIMRKRGMKDGNGRKKRRKRGTPSPSCVLMTHCDKIKCPILHLEAKKGIVFIFFVRLFIFFGLENNSCRSLRREGIQIMK